MADAILNPCVVYALFSSEDGEIRYIGQTKRLPEIRLAAHRASAKLGATHRESWIRSVLNRGHSVEMFILRSAAEWSVDECVLITAYRALGCRLVNATAGGDGVRDPSPEVRRKISEKSQGRQLTDIQRAAMSERAKAIGISTERRAKMIAGVRRAYSERGEEISARLSAVRIGHQVSAGTRLKLASAMRGKSHSDKTKALISRMNMIRFGSADEILRIADATKAAMRRPEVKAKVRAAAALTWADPERRRAQAERVSARFRDPMERALQSERRAKMTPDQVIEARQRRKAGATLGELCAAFGVSRTSMSLLCNGKTFRHLPMPD